MKRFEPKLVMDILLSKPVSVLCAPPTLYRNMVASEETFHFKALRSAVGAGESVNAEVMRAWKEKTGIQRQMNSVCIHFDRIHMAAMTLFRLSFFKSECNPVILLAFQQGIFH